MRGPFASRLGSWWLHPHVEDYTSWTLTSCSYVVRSVLVSWYRRVLPIFPTVVTPGPGDEGYGCLPRDHRPNLQLVYYDGYRGHMTRASGDAVAIVSHRVVVGQCWEVGLDKLA